MAAIPWRRFDPSGAADAHGARSHAGGESEGPIARYARVRKVRLGRRRGLLHASAPAAAPLPLPALLALDLHAAASCLRAVCPAAAARVGTNRQRRARQ